MAEVVREDHLLEPDANAWFFKETSLEELVAGAKSLVALEDLAIEDLTPDKAASFLRAIGE